MDIHSEHKAIREAQRLYMKEWRRKNPDKVKANNRAYWLRKAKQNELKDGESNGKTGSVCGGTGKDFRNQ